MTSKYYQVIFGLNMFQKNIGSIKKLAKKVTHKRRCHNREKVYAKERLLVQDVEECVSTTTPRGFLAVYVGDERKRFVVPTSSLSHPLFKILLAKASEEFGYEQKNGLAVPCSVEAFEEVVSVMKCMDNLFFVAWVLRLATGFAVKEMDNLCNRQVKDNKIDLFVQKYEEFIITDDETIDCAFARFNTIITSLKALDESFSSRNHVRKFLRALPTKWRLKVTVIEESKDLSTLPLDELIGNLKVYEVVLEKLEISKSKKEKYKLLALKARKVLSEEEATSSDSDDEEYAMAKDDRRCFKCGDLNYFISDCPKHSFNDQKAFVVGCWSASGDDSKKEETCLMALDNNEVHLKVKLEPDEWIKDNRCSRHRTGNKDLFSSYKTIYGGNVVFGGNTKSKIVRKDTITHNSLTIQMLVM
ncbi:zf-CCHC domain-containing protein [Tanacetum coccineum]